MQKTSMPWKTRSLSEQKGNSSVCYVTEIFDAQYKWTDITDVVNKLTHLNANQKADLLQLLQKNCKMFDL